MKQSLTSAATSINRSKLPAVYRKIGSDIANSIVVDYGCGKYTDHIKAHLAGIQYLPYDPYNQPHSVNNHTIACIDTARHDDKPITVICSNVLNVIDSEEEIKRILWNIWTIIKHYDSLAYITVYEGDRSGTGKQTGKDSWQRNEKLANYLRFMPERTQASIRNGMIIMTRRH